jgi:hypothetical protein
VGRTYSVNGYINAVLQRTSPTLLVEGVTDKSAMHRLVAERTLPAGHQFSIDHPAIFEDAALHGKGAKAKVLHVTSEVNRLTQRFAKLSSVFAHLVDREWDGLAQDPKSAVEGWTQPQQSANTFVTIGHSIENYHFHPDCFVDYLRFGFAEHFSTEVEDSVRRLFANSVALAGAVSCEARDSQCLTRLSGLIGSTHVELTPAGTFYLASNLVAPLAARCGFDGAVFVAQVNAAVDSHWAELSRHPSSRWVLHGHVGSEVIWACVGLAAISAGVPAVVGEQIARGFQDERRRCWLTWLSRVSPELRTPLDQAVSWLVHPPANASR